MKHKLKGHVTMPTVIAFVAFVAGWDPRSGWYWWAGILSVLVTVNIVLHIIAVRTDLKAAHMNGKVEGIEEARSVWRSPWV